MSITSAMYTGVSGMKANSEAMGVIGNNISNVNTTGFKSGRTLFSDLLSQDIGRNNSEVGLGTQIQKVENQFFAGTLQTTANITDVALQGDNLFFAVAPVTPGAQTAPTTAITPDLAQLTRAGAFHVNTAGVGTNRYLVNPDGKYVLDSTGKAIDFSTWTAASGTFNKITGIDADGTIHAVSTTGEIMSAATVQNARIGVVRVEVPSELQKSGNSLYAPSIAAGVPVTYANGGATASGLSASESVVSNSLESSNVDMATEMVNMIITQRAYSANSKTITVNDQLTNDAIQMVR